MNTPAETLTKEEQVEFAACEKTISHGKAEFEKVGRALYKIRESRLYRQSFSSFESYCLQKWGWSGTTCNRHIAAVKVLDNLAPIGCDLPKNERQLRELATLPEDKQREAWAMVQEKTAAENRKPTTEDVREAAQEVSEKPRPMDGQWTAALGGIKTVEEFTAPSKALELGRYNGCVGRAGEIEETMDQMQDSELLEKLHHRFNAMAAKARKLAQKRAEVAA